MDVLRLLTRSTNLQKTLPQARDKTRQIIPSAGAGPELEVLLQDESTRAHLKGLAEELRLNQGIKRKRTSMLEERAHEVDSVPDFFAPNTKSRSGIQAPTTHSGNGKAQGTNEDMPSRDHVSVPMMPEDERRRVLNSHKLKITALSRPATGLENGVKRRKKQQNSDKKECKANAQLFPQPLLSFKELRSRYRISKRLADNLHSQGYSTPTEVQLGALPLLLGSEEERGLPKGEVEVPQTGSGTHVDLVTIAPTGSGKTLAFLIPLMNNLLHNRHASGGDATTTDVQSIVLAPTHELADQIVNEGKKLALGTGLKITAMKKGMRLHQKNSTALAEVGSWVKADIVVSTPLVLLNSLSAKPEEPQTSLPSIRYIVFDEADVLLDPLFRDQTLAIWNACTNQSLQVSLWSATIGASIETLAQSTIMQRRLNLGLHPANHYILRLIAGLKDSALPAISHRLIYAATEAGKLLAVRQLLHPSTSSGPALRPPFLIFTQTIPRATALHAELLYDIPPEAGGSARIGVLHASLSDTARSETMAAFRRGEIWVLITTDLLARGIDFRGVNGVVNYDIPNTSAVYVHRAGRTGRAGREGGVAITLYTKEDVPYVRNIANVIAAAGNGNGKAKGEGGVEKWLLDALPSVSKKMKKELKRGGVESRRVVKEGEEGRMTDRISTKSGFERRAENKRRGAVEGSKARSKQERQDIRAEASDSEWAGLED